MFAPFRLYRGNPESRYPERHALLPHGDRVFFKITIKGCKIISQILMDAKRIASDFPGLL